MDGSIFGYSGSNRVETGSPRWLEVLAVGHPGESTLSSQQEAFDPTSVCEGYASIRQMADLLEIQRSM